MKKTLPLVLLFAMALSLAFAQKNDDRTKLYDSPNSPIDNISHWEDMAKRGIIPAYVPIPVKPAVEGSSWVQLPAGLENSPDVLVLDVTGTTQHENSIFVNPNDRDEALNSNNSFGSTSVYGANYVLTTDGGLGWTGSELAAGGTDKGDPAACIGLNGRYYIGAINSSRKQVVSWSDDAINWTKVNVVSGSLVSPDLLDKNHLWIDNTNSDQEGNLYNAWSHLEVGHVNDGEIEFSRSLDDGLTWSTPIQISSNVAAGSHNQGVNISCNNTGWVFAVWVIYDDWGTGLYGEDAIGFARSPNGGSSFYSAQRIVSDINGIRGTTPNSTGKNHRVNSFPSMAIDVSGGTYHGHQYVVWANVGVPGDNTGTNVSVYMIKSTNGGTVWSTPLQINSEAASDHAAYFPWITCDPVTGNLYVIFYDDRNFDAASGDVETWVAYSNDGGATWDDLCVSDVSFTPSPAGSAGYFGDYLGISAYDGKVYPTWTDNRSGDAQTYVSPLDFGCSASSNSTSYEYISNVSFGSINNASGASSYTDYTNQVNDLPLNAEHNLTVTNGQGYASNLCGVWIDWNQDDDFEDANETITMSGNPGAGPYSAVVQPPPGTALGACKMRVRIVYSGVLSPCGTSSYGEVEDYTVNVLPEAPNEWTGDFNIWWHNANNWTLGHIPTADEDVVITSAGWSPPKCDAQYNEECNNLTIQTGSTLNIVDDELVVNGNLTVDGTLGMTHANATLTCYGNVIWNSGSTVNITAAAKINAYGDWDFKSGANVNPALGFVDFRGTSLKYIRCFSDNCSFYNLRNYKSGGAYLGFSAQSTAPLRISNLLYTFTGSVFNSYTSQDIIIKGSFNYYGTFDLTLGGNTGSLIFDGVSDVMNNYNTGSGLLNNVVFSSSTGTTIGGGDLEVAKSVTIEEGNLSLGSNNVTLGGNWTNTGGTVVPGTSMVTFSSNGTHQDVTGTNTFYNVSQVNMAKYLRFYDPTTILNNLELHYFCWAYEDFQVDGILNINDPVSKFTSSNATGNATIGQLDQGGSLVCNGMATLTVSDLVENGIFGKYYVNTAGGVLNLTNSGSGTWVDLNGEIHITGGTMNVTGSLSDWPYSQNAVIEMSDGILDFKTCGITVADNSYTLTSTITGGKIRTAGGFSGNRADFTPAAGTLELYGPLDVSLNQANGSTLYDVIINKSSTKSAAPLKSSGVAPGGGRKDNTAGSGTKANGLGLTSGITVTNDLHINNGSLALNGHGLSITHNCNVYGTLVMNNPADILTVGTDFWDEINFQYGSVGDFSSGVVNMYGWFFTGSGCSFTATTDNTIVFKGNTGGGINNSEPSAVFGNVEIFKNSSQETYIGSIWPEPVVISGDLTVHPNNRFKLNDQTVILNGTVFDDPTSEIQLPFGTKAVKGMTSPFIGENGQGGQPVADALAGVSADLGAKGGYFEVDGDMVLNGLLDVDDGEFLHHGLFTMENTGEVTISSGSFINDYVLNGWSTIYGTLTMAGGILEFTNSSLHLVGVSDVSGGTIRLGKSFWAEDGGAFKPSGGTLELFGSAVGSYIRATGENYLHDLLYNRSTSCLIYPASTAPLEIRGALELNSGSINANYNDITIRGNWVNNVGYSGFIPTTATVTFTGVEHTQIVSTGEHFYNLTENKASSALWLDSYGLIEIDNDLVINQGDYYPHENTVTVAGNATINSAGAIYLVTGSLLEIDGDFAQDGLLDVGNGDVLNHGYFTMANTGDLMITNGSFINDYYLTGWSTIYGNLTMSGGILEFTNSGFNLVGVSDVSGGTIRLGKSFWTSGANAFKPSGGTVELFGSTTGTYISVTGNNYLHDLLYNRATSCLVYPASTAPLEIRGALELNSGSINANYNDISIRGNWVNNVGYDGFIPTTATVTFTGAEHTQIVSTGEHFYNVTENKGSSALWLDSYGLIEIDNDLVINQGEYTSHDNPVSVAGNVTINSGGTLNIGPGSSLEVGDGGSLLVGSGGWLNVLGNSITPATITHKGSGYYNFDILSSGGISAKYAVFEYMTGDGVFVHDGAVIDPVNSFNYCTFQNGSPGWAVLLLIDNADDVTITGAVFPDASSSDFNVGKEFNLGTVTLVDASGDFAGEDFDLDPFNRVDWTITERALDLTVFLEGPFNASTNQMATGINGLLPLDQPFGPGLPYFGNPVPPDWYYAGTENAGAVPNGSVVDWVLVQLRDAASAAAALPSTAFHTMPAFILNTGQVVGMDGSSPPTFTGIPANGLFVVVWHRNHLGLMSAAALSEAGGTYAFDFSSGSSQAYGGSAAQVQLSTTPAIWGMPAGDGDGNGEIGISDKLNVWYLLAGEQGYSPADFSMDGQVNNPDKDDYWAPNLGTSSFIPE